MEITIPMTGRRLVTTAQVTSHYGPLQVFLRSGGSIHWWRHTGPGAGNWALCRGLLLRQEKRNNRGETGHGETEEEEALHWTLLSEEEKRKEGSGEKYVVVVLDMIKILFSKYFCVFLGKLSSYLVLGGIFSRYLLHNVTIRW